MRVVRAGHAAFAAAMIALGILGLLKGDFPPIWDPVPKAVPAREVLVYSCSFSLFGVRPGPAVAWRSRRRRSSAARVTPAMAAAF